MNPSLTCQQLLDFLMDYTDGSLPAEQRAEFHRHLALCPSCVNYVEQYKTTIALGKAAFECRKGEAPPPQVPEELIQAILAARKKRA